MTPDESGVLPGWAGHTVTITFDGGVGLELHHPASGCDPVTVCGECGRDAANEDERQPCEYCPRDGDECWLQGWVDNLDALEMLDGQITVPIVGEWDGDSTTLYIGKPPEVGS